MKDYPIDSMELARRVVGYREGTSEFVHLVQRCIRPALRRFNCPKTGPAVRSRYIIDRDMAERVAAECGDRYPEVHETRDCSRPTKRASQVMRSAIAAGRRFDDTATREDPTSATTPNRPGT